MQLQSILGKKQNQTQAFLQNGTRIPVSVIDVSGNFVAQIKTNEKEGYNAVQIAFGNKKKLNNPLKGHVKKAGLEKTPAFFREVRVGDVDGLSLGTQINVSDVFTPGDIVDVSGVSKGKGFAGGVKRHHFQGGPRTHGQSDRERAPGSLGQTTTPGRVYKGKKMAGRMGHENVTLKNLEIIEITNDGLILVKGLVPGGINSLVVVKKVGENKKFVPLYKEAVEEPVSEETPAEIQKAGAATSPVSDDAKQNEDSLLSASDDVQPIREEAQTNTQVSLSDSRQSDSEEKQETKEEATVNASDSGQKTVSSEAEDKKEPKEEVKENASS